MLNALIAEHLQVNPVKQLVSFVKAVVLGCINAMLVMPRNLAYNFSQFYFELKAERQVVV
jgi:heme/copper-type cytochrome/quinol oxidase subunit 4